jgi:hypothetical protein
MQRPVLNPLIHADLDAPPAPPTTMAHRLLTPLRLLFRILLADVAFWSRRPKLQIEDASPLRRVFLGLFYRLLLVPVALVLFVAVLVYTGSHPPRMSGITDPLSSGTYYDPVNFVSADGTCLEGWFVPALEAKTILEQKDQALRQTRPAVILVHDVGADRLQMLPLVQPLHDAGYVVLVSTLRGHAGLRGSTFGLKESEDVEAAAAFLRSRPGVDPKRVAVLGIGTGANAALLTAIHDGQVAAVVLDHPLLSADEAIAQRMGPPQPWLDFLRPVCKWTFEIAYCVDAEDLDLASGLKDLGSRPVLYFKAPSSLAEAFHSRGWEQIQEFLAKSMPEPKPTEFKPASTATIEIR